MIQFWRSLRDVKEKERAIKLYRERRISVSTAAEMANLTVLEIVDYLMRHDVKQEYCAASGPALCRFISEINLLGIGDWPAAENR